MCFNGLKGRALLELLGLIGVASGGGTSSVCPLAAAAAAASSLHGWGSKSGERLGDAAKAVDRHTVHTTDRQQIVSTNVEDPERTPNPTPEPLAKSNFCLDHDPRSQSKHYKTLAYYGESGQGRTAPTTVHPKALLS